MMSYHAHGLTIHSALPLPELLTKEGSADIVIRLRSAERLRVAATVGNHMQASAGEAELVYDGVGAFQVRGGREIIITPAPGVEERTLRLFLLGPALAVLLHQRGRLILHASAVAEDGRAVVFLGGSGWGKSTIAAALHVCGHPVLADDVVAVDSPDGGCPLVYPGVPQLKLWPDVIRTLGGSQEALMPLRPHLEKRAYPVHNECPMQPLALDRLYVLAEGPVREIEPLGHGEAVVELIRHTYGMRLLSGINPRSHLLQCAALARRVPARRLRRPRALQALPTLARYVKDDMAYPSVRRRRRAG